MELRDSFPNQRAGNHHWNSPVLFQSNRLATALYYHSSWWFSKRTGKNFRSTRSSIPGLTVALLNMHGEERKMSTGTVESITKCVDRPIVNFIVTSRDRRHSFEISDVHVRESLNWKSIPLTSITSSKSGRTWVMYRFVPRKGRTLLSWLAKTIPRPLKYLKSVKIRPINEPLVCTWQLLVCVSQGQVDNSTTTREITTIPSQEKWSVTPCSSNPSRPILHARKWTSSGLPLRKKDELQEEFKQTTYTLAPLSILNNSLWICMKRMTTHGLAVKSTRPQIWPNWSRFPTIVFCKESADESRNHRFRLVAANQPFSLATSRCQSLFSILYGFGKVRLAQRSAGPAMLPFWSPPKAFPPNWIWQLREGVRESETKGGACHHESSWNLFAARQKAPLRFFLSVSASSARANFFLGRHVAWRPSRPYLFNLSVCVFLFVCVLNCWSPRRDLLSGSHFDLCQDAWFGSHCVRLSLRFSYCAVSFVFIGKQPVDDYTNTSALLTDVPFVSFPFRNPRGVATNSLSGNKSPSTD